MYIHVHRSRFFVTVQTGTGAHRVFSGGKAAAVWYYLLIPF